MQDEINLLKSENRSNIAMIEQLNSNITILSRDTKVSFSLGVEFVSRVSQDWDKISEDGLWHYVHFKISSYRHT